MAFNGLGFLLLILFWCLFSVARLLLSLVLGHSRDVDLLVICLAASACALVDLWYRGHGAKDARPYFFPSEGGHINFLPVWMIGLMVVLGAVACTSLHIMPPPMPARKAPQQAPGPRSQPVNSVGSGEGQSSPRQGAASLPRSTSHGAMLPASVQSGRRHLSAPLPSA
jgi:hypothetical protein